MADLVIRDFAHIRSVTVPLRDLVVLVGPQATGKSLVLEMLKLAKDRPSIQRILRGHGYAWDDATGFGPLYFGAGFEGSWRQETSVTIGAKQLQRPGDGGSRVNARAERVFYIPAHRTLTIAEGAPRPFLQFSVETPYVVRRFSEELLSLLARGLGSSGSIFPAERRLQSAFRTCIENAVFHEGELRLERSGLRRQLVLRYGPAVLPFMSWSAGQRELVPLLLGLYHLLPAGAIRKRADIEWAIIEEPEMGLHPKAIVAVVCTLLELLKRGYRVALSTHSPTVLEAMWALDRLGNVPDGDRLLCEAFDLKTGPQVLATMQAALKASRAVVYLSQDSGGKVESTDISGLRPDAADSAEAAWGGLSEFSGRIASVVARAAARRPEPRRRARRTKR